MTWFVSSESQGQELHPMTPDGLKEPELILKEYVDYFCPPGHPSLYFLTSRPWKLETMTL